MIVHLDNKIKNKTRYYRSDPIPLEVLSCKVCNKSLVCKKSYRPSYRLHLCSECAAILSEYYVKEKNYVLENYPHEMISYNKNYGFSIKSTFFRERIYEMYGRFRKTNDIGKLLKEFYFLGQAGKEYKVKRFIQLEINVYRKAFLNEENIF
jgi:hypothetical protein